jgi:trehalose 6-phosphate synthase/phosphatase
LPLTPGMSHRQALEYCEGTLRNVFHGFVDVYGRVPTKWWNPNAQMGSWYAYLQAGKAFAGVVQGLYDERTMVWVHGCAGSRCPGAGEGWRGLTSSHSYELIPALPQLARKLHATGTRVGFSLHRPFPSSEIFRTLSVRVELLRAILSANVITFHLYEVGGRRAAGVAVREAH